MNGGKTRLKGLGQRKMCPELKWINHKRHGGEESWKQTRRGYPELGENENYSSSRAIRSVMKLDDKL